MAAQGQDEQQQGKPRHGSCTRQADQGDGTGKMCREQHPGMQGMGTFGFGAGPGTEGVAPLLLRHSPTISDLRPFGSGRKLGRRAAVQALAAWPLCAASGQLNCAVPDPLLSAALPGSPALSMRGPGGSQDIRWWAC